MRTAVTLSLPRSSRFEWKLVATGFFLSILLLASQALNAQAPIIEYPVAAQNITRAYGQSNLTIKLIFNGNCASTSVRIGLPSSVTYVAGSVSKTGGAIGLNITESNISDLSRPLFSITGSIAVGNELVFTVARRATCGSSATGKDSVYVITSGGCSNGSETSSSVNTYNILAPSLSLTPAPAINNAVIGTTANRTTTVTNGGNGATDTLRFAIVYPGGGIANTSGTNSIVANGTSFAPSQINGDTLFYKIYGATLFNGNAIFENGETVTINEPVRITGCSTTTTYRAGWGRANNTLCQVASGTSAVTMAVGVPNVVVSSQVRVQGTNMCDSAIIEVTFRNAGSEAVTGAGTAFNLTELIGINGGEAINIRQDLFVTAITLRNGAAWMPLTHTGGGPFALGAAGTAATINLSQLNSTAAGSGLIDANGDGIYNDLAVGGTFTLRYKVGYVARISCGTGYHSGAPVYKTNHQDQCGATVNTNQLAGSTASQGQSLWLSNRTLTATTVTSPPDIVDGQTVTMRIAASRDFVVNGTHTLYTCPTNLLILRVVVPKGISMVNGRFYRSTSTTTNNVISTSTVPGLTRDTLVIVGNRPDGNYNSFAYEADLTLNCASFISQGAITYSLSYVCDGSASCSSQEVWVCGTVPLNVHCTPPCMEGGLTPVGSIMKRTTAGYANATSSTYANLASLTDKQLQFVMPGDSVMGVFKGKLYGGTAAPFNGQYFHLSYTAPGGTMVFEPYAAVLKRYNAGLLMGTFTIAAPSTNSITSGVHHIEYNLSSYGLVPNDSIVLEPVFFVRNNASLSNTPVSLSNMVVDMYSTNTVSPTTQYTCDHFSAEVYPYRPVISIYNGTGDITNTGCNSYTHSSFMYVTGPSHDLYPNEVRNVPLLDSVKMEILNGDFFNGPLRLYSYGTTSEGNNITTTIPASYTAAGGKTSVYVNNGSWPKGEVVGGSAAYQFNFNFINGCQSAANGVIRVTYYYKRYGYVHESSFMLSTNDGPYARNIINTTPTTEARNNTGTLQGVQPNQYWDVAINNPSSYTAPYIWLAMEKSATSGIVVDSVKLMPSGTVVPVASNYGTGNKWYQVSAAGLSSGAAQNARVFFHYTNCTLDSIEMKTGWNCSGYPTTDPSTYACTASSVFLKVDPQPSQVQLSVERQPGGVSGQVDMCSTDSTILVVNSAQAGNLVLPNLTFYPPSGISLGSDIQVEFPAGSGNYQSAAVTSIGGGGYRLDLSSHSLIGSNGMPGTATVASSAGRQARIKVTFNTVCGFTSGTSFVFNAFANRSCGTTATGNGVSATTQGVRVNGVAATGGAGMTIDVGATSDVSCSSNTVVSNSITPTGTSTQAGDTIIYQLPAGVAYAGGLTSGFTASVHGQTLKIALPTNTTSGTTINYNFNVTANGSGCSSGNITASFRREIAPLMCGGIACTSSNTIIASRTIATTINKPNLQLTAMNHVTGNWLRGSTSVVRMSYGNTGSQNYVANSAVMEFFCGNNTTPFATLPITRNLAAGGSTTEEFSVYVPTTGCADDDAITARIQTTTSSNATQCLCAPSSYTLPGIVLPVVFTSASATAAQCRTDINWSYAQTGSVGDIRFTIERSRDGSSYTSIATVSQEVKSYSDAVPSSGTWYYRIKAQEAGTSKVVYSNTMRVNVNQCVNGANVKVYPNPASNELHVSIDASAQDANYDLTDMLGRTVAKGRLNSGADNRIDIHKLAAGTYMLKLSLNGTVQTQKINIER